MEPLDYSRPATSHSKTPVTILGPGPRYDTCPCISWSQTSTDFRHQQTQLCNINTLLRTLTTGSHKGITRKHSLSSNLRRCRPLYEGLPSTNVINIHPELVQFVFTPKHKTRPICLCQWWKHGKIDLDLRHDNSTFTSFSETSREKATFVNYSITVAMMMMMTHSFSQPNYQLNL